MTPHIHRDVIIAWANGAVPEVPFSLEPKECESGIHFFRTYQEAERYSW